MRNRGSALVFVLVLTLAMGSVILAIVALAGYQHNTATHDEQIMRAQLAREGAIAQIKYDIANGNQAVPYSTTISVGSFSWAATVADNTANITDTALVTLSSSRWNKTYTWSRVIGNSTPVHDPSWWTFALAVNSSYAYPHNIQTHGATDDMYENPTFTVAAASTLKMDLYTVTGGVPTNVTVQGTFFGSTTAKKWPRAKASLYAAAADTTLNGDQVINTYNFSSAYRLVYINGNLDYHGKITGSGIFFVTGDITISDNVNYNNNTNDYVAFITPNSIHFTKDGSTLWGYYYAGNTFDLQGHMNFNKGCFVCKNISVLAGKDLDVTGDPRVLNTPSIGVSLKLPGCWP